MTRPLQVYLDEEDFEQLKDWAVSRGWTQSQTVRAAIRALTRQREEHPLLALSGIVDGLPEDLSENFDRYLDETYVVAESSPRYGRAKQRARRRLRR